MKISLKKINLQAEIDKFVESSKIADAEIGGVNASPLDLSAVTACSLSWEISKGSVTGSFEFTVRHVGGGRLL